MIFTFMTIEYITEVRNLIEFFDFVICCSNYLVVLAFRIIFLLICYQKLGFTSFCVRHLRELHSDCNMSWTYSFFLHWDSNEGCSSLVNHEGICFQQDGVLSLLLKD